MERADFGGDADELRFPFGGFCAPTVRRRCGARRNRRTRGRSSLGASAGGRGGVPTLPRPLQIGLARAEAVGDRLSHSFGQLDFVDDYAEQSAKRSSRMYGLPTYTARLHGNTRCTCRCSRATCRPTSPDDLWSKSVRRWARSSAHAPRDRSGSRDVSDPLGTRAGRRIESGVGSLTPRLHRNWRFSGRRKAPSVWAASSR